MTDVAALREVADRGGAWRDETDSHTAAADAARLGLLADLLDGPPPAGSVPPLWLGLLTATWPAYEALGPDGHPLAGVGFPPIADRRRMFAGGRLRVHAQTAIGADVARTTRVVGVRVAEGRTGALLFVTVSHTFAVGAAVVAEEEQDVVYRSGPPQAAGEQPAPAPADGLDAELTLTPDPVALFRMSALTANSHRIHYDATYATEVEGLPGRLVHGPFLALLLLELPRRLAPERTVSAYRYRLTRPVVVGTTIGAGRMAGSTVPTAP